MLEPSTWSALPLQSQEQKEAAMQQTIIHLGLDVDEENVPTRPRGVNEAYHQAQHGGFNL